MSESELNTPRYRYDPYKGYRFRVKWESSYMAAFTKVSGLARQAEVITNRSGSDPASAHAVPGQAEYSPISLERGVTYDTGFEQWANKVWDFSASSNQPVSLQDFRKDIVIELYNEAGQKVVAYKVYRCWPSEFVAAPELDGTGNAVVIQTMTLQYESLERDTSVVEPMEPSFDLPR